MTVISSGGSVLDRYYGTAKAAVHSGMHEIGGPKALAARVGRKMSLVSSWANPNSDRYPPFDVICEMVRGGALGPVHHLCALAGGYFVPNDPCATAVILLIADVVRAAGEAIEATIRAIRDGAVSLDEQGRCLREIDEAVAAMVALRCKVSATEEMRRGVAGEAIFVGCLPDSFVELGAGALGH